MPPLPPARQSDQSLAHEGAAIVYRSRVAPWLRWLVLVFVLPLPVCLTFYAGLLRRTDWAAVSLPGFAVITLALVVAPLVFAAAALAYALRAPEEHLRLDPDRAEALLELKTPFGRRHWRYPLQGVTVDQVEMEGDHPAFETSRFRLRMPDGRAVWIAAFFRPQEAQSWLAAIRALLSEAAPGPR